MTASEIRTITHEEMLDLCRKAWAKLHLKAQEPDLCITFSSGGLFTTGYFQKIGLPKVPVLALPWHRNMETAQVEGECLMKLLPKDYFNGKYVRVSVIDDIFDTGITLRRLFKEIQECNTTGSALDITAFAPIKKDCFPDREMPVYAGVTVSKDLWIQFGWEVGVD